MFEIFAIALFQFSVLFGGSPEAAQTGGNGWEDTGVSAPAPTPPPAQTGGNGWEDTGVTSTSTASTTTKP